MKYTAPYIAIILLTSVCFTACTSTPENSGQQNNPAEIQKKNARDAQDELSTETSRPGRSY